MLLDGLGCIPFSIHVVLSLVLAAVSGLDVVVVGFSLRILVVDVPRLAELLQPQIFVRKFDVA